MSGETELDPPEVRRLIRKAIHCGLSVGGGAGEPLHVKDLSYPGYLTNRGHEPLTEEGIRIACCPYLTLRWGKVNRGKHRETRSERIKIEKVFRYLEIPDA